MEVSNGVMPAANMLAGNNGAESIIGSSLSSPVLLSLALMLMAVLPLFMMAVTSYIKISVVLNILRNALGAGQIPSGAIIGLLSLVLSLHVMSPVATNVHKRFEESYSKTEQKVSITKTLDSICYSIEPLQMFLKKHSGKKEREFFAEMSIRNLSAVTNKQSDNLTNQSGVLSEQQSLQSTIPTQVEEQEGIDGESFFSIVPAFVLSELSSAFKLGFMIYLPFLVLDIVITNLLVGLGMMMVSPATIALPLKLLLFVSCDGWFILCRSLVLSY